MPDAEGRATARFARTAARGTAGFTLMEVLVTMTIISMLFAMVVPNLGTFVPTARLEGSGKQIKAKIDWIRSEARIRGRPMAVELDLERHRWRVIYPPDMRLTLDQDEDSLKEFSFEWQKLEEGVVFAGAGDAKNGIAHRGTYRIRFDEYGFSNDQVISLTLSDDPNNVWSISLRGLTGVTSIETSNEGHIPELIALGEGAF